MESIELRVKQMEEDLRSTRIKIQAHLDYMVSLEGFDKAFIMERIVMFGSLSIPYVKELYLQTQNYDELIICAIALLDWGDDSVIPTIAKYALNTNDYSCLAVNKMASHSRNELYPDILKRLKSELHEEELVGIILYLKKIGKPIPLDMLASLKGKYNTPKSLHLKHLLTSPDSCI